MWRPRSFASRLSLTVLAVSGLIQILLCAMILVTREGEVRRGFDERLTLRASAALHIVEPASQRTGQIVSAPLTASPASAVAVTGLYWQLRRHDGTVIARCADLGETSVPAPPAEPGNDGGPILMTWRDTAVTALAGRPEALHVATLRGGIEGGSTFDIQARQRGVRLIPMLRDGHQPHVAGHADLLRVTLQNLVRNAIDHSPDGASVHIAISQLDFQERILVSDTGPGIPPEFLPQVFDRFISGRPAVADTGGHGLGLAISRRAVEAHGGTIAIANRAAGGCEVEILLPSCTSQGGAVGPAS